MTDEKTKLKIHSVKNYYKDLSRRVKEKESKFKSPTKSFNIKIKLDFVAFRF